MFYSHYNEYMQGGANMLDWICKKLEDKAAEKQHEVIKLQWQKAKLQQLLDQKKKREQEHGQSKTE
jgi:hypothetical protein